jgi:hypothetical protein
MAEMSKGETARAGSEARDAIASRPQGSRSAAIAAAMRRYLSSETYDQQRKHDAENAEDDQEGSGRER